MQIQKHFGGKEMQRYLHEDFAVEELLKQIVVKEKQNSCRKA